MGLRKVLSERRLLWYQRQRREERPSVMYVGKKRRGKSLCMTQHALSDMRSGIRVFANYRLVDLANGESCETWSSFRELLLLMLDAVENGDQFDIVIDEAQNLFDARDWEKCPKWFRFLLSELSHYNGCLIMATQVYSMVDKRARQLADVTYRVRPMFPGWHHRFSWFILTELVEDFESVEEDAQTFGKVHRRHVKGDVFGAYDTVKLPTDDAVADAKDAELLYAELRSKFVDVLERPSLITVESMPRVG